MKAALIPFIPSTVKSLVPEPILSIVQSVLPLGSIAGDEIAKVTFTFLSAVLPPSDQALVPHLNPQSSGSGKSFGIISINRLLSKAIWDPFYYYFICHFGASEVTAELLRLA